MSEREKLLQSLVATLTHPFHYLLTSTPAESCAHLAGEPHLTGQRQVSLRCVTSTCVDATRIELTLSHPRKRQLSQTLDEKVALPLTHRHQIMDSSSLSRPRLSLMASGRNVITSHSRPTLERVSTRMRHQMAKRRAKSRRHSRSSAKTRH
jgi:hypothetical protein